MTFWTLVFALSMAFIVAIVVTTLLKVQAGFRAPDANDVLSAREAERILAENEQLKKTVGELGTADRAGADCDGSGGTCVG
jgi:hypothetical protein